LRERGGRHSSRERSREERTPFVERVRTPFGEGERRTPFVEGGRRTPSIEGGRRTPRYQGREEDAVL